jgi:hypothetical protein
MRCAEDYRGDVSAATLNRYGLLWLASWRAIHQPAFICARLGNCPVPPNVPRSGRDARRHFREAEGAATWAIAWPCLHEFLAYRRVAATECCPRPITGGGLSALAQTGRGGGVAPSVRVRFQRAFICARFAIKELLCFSERLQERARRPPPLQTKNKSTAVLRGVVSEVPGIPSDLSATPPREALP